MSGTRLTGDQWRRARELFEAAIDAPPVDIDGWLSAQSDDEEVRREVASLLSHHTQAGAFLTEPVGDLSELLEDAPEFAAGDLLGPYRIDGEAGRGGMGRVYRAVDTRLNRTVAIKALPRELAPDPAQRERLRREARAAAALSHPGICTVFSLEEFDGGLFIVSEFIDGRTLQEEIADSRRPGGRLPPPALVLDTARQLAGALASAHAAGITHRDLKPENVMRTADGRIKVLDFGLARQPASAATGAASLVTQTGTVIGTPAYMAPEQLNGEPADPRTDVFAFGLLLHEYASGRHPFDAPTALARIGRVLAAPPDPLAGRRDDLPAALSAALARCLAKSPDERFASAIDLLGALPESDAFSGGGRAIGRPPAGDRARWWRVHQVAVIGLYFVAAVLAWFVKEWVRGRTSAIFIAIGVLGTIVGMLRGHLLFTERTHGAGFARERDRMAVLTVAGDLALAVLLAGDGLALVSASREVVAVLTIAWAVAIAVSRLLIEPATVRAAFGDKT